MRNNYKAMSNKRLASTIWKKLGSPLVGAYVILSIIYFILMGCTSTGISGPTVLGTFLLGGYTYVVAHTLFYMGGCILGLVVGLAIALVVLVRVADAGK